MFLMPSSCLGLEQDGAVLVLDLERDAFRGHGRQEIEEVLGVEADLDVVALVLDVSLSRASPISGFEENRRMRFFSR